MMNGEEKKKKKYNELHVDCVARMDFFLLLMSSIRRKEKRIVERASECVRERFDVTMRPDEVNICSKQR